MKNKKYAWAPSDSTRAIGPFDSKEEAVADALLKLQKGEEPYEDGDEYNSSIITVGTVIEFDLDSEVGNFIDGFGDYLDDYLRDLGFGIDAKGEYYFPKNNGGEKAFKEKAKAALLPLVKEHIRVNIPWLLCCDVGQYDLVKNEWGVTENGEE